MKKILFFNFFILISFAGAFSSQLNSTSEELLQRASLEFSNRNYGSAVKLAEKAKEKRSTDVTKSLFVLNQSLHSKEVRDQGDNISNIIHILHEREDEAAISILNGEVVKIPFDSVNNSITKFLARLEEYKNFPEADFLIGQVYVISGEYILAKKYLLSALKNADLLDIPQQRVDILYSIATLANLEGDKELFEKTLLLIGADERLWQTNGKPTPFVESIINSLKKGISLDKFFNLYRHNSPSAMKAYGLLGDFYMKNGDNELALTYSAIGTLSIFSYILSVIVARNVDYEYTGFSDFLKQLSVYPDIIEWARNNEIWKGFYNFAEAGDREFPIELPVEGEHFVCDALAAVAVGL
ncbi:MAG: hypothetical protein IIW10_06705, partial [Spirochaetaceae bacterium]|nr:hypothetical protein [Spirochaetaceae bacterium]